MQEKMEELRRRYLEKDSEEICQKFEDDIEIVKSGKTVSSEYHIPKTDFIYDSDEQLSNDEEQFQHLSVLGEATSVGYDSAGSADTDEIIAMNASRSKAGSSKNSVTNKEQITPLKKPVVNELVSKPNIDQVLTIGDKISPISKLPLKTQQNLEIVLSYVDNTMKQIPFRGMAMLDCESMERVTKTTIQSEGECESDTKPENEIDDSGEPNTNKLLSDSELDSDDFEKVALKYSGSLSVPKVSDTQLDIIKTNLQEKNISNKILTESDSEDTDDMIKKLKSNEKTTKLIVTAESHSDKTDTCHLKHNDTSMLLNISNKKDTSTDSDLDSDDFEKVAGKYLSFVEKDTIPSSKLTNDCDDGSTVDDDIADKSCDFKDKLERNESECMVTDKSIDYSEDDAGDGMKKTDQDRIDSSYDESSDVDNSNSDEESDSIDQSNDEDASENINGNEQGDEDTSSEDSNNNDDEKDGDDENSDDDDGDDDDNSDDDGDDDDKDEDDDDEKDDDDESENDEDNDEGNEDSKKKVEEEDESHQNKNFFVSSSLFSAFVKREKDINSGFSFLKTFGNQNTSEPKKLELPRHLRNEEETESDKSDEIEENQIPKSSTSFFFQPKDVRLQEGVKFFHRKIDIEEIEDKWNQVKPVFLATCRQRNRLALKRLDQEKLKKRKMTFTKSFMSKNRK